MPPQKERLARIQALSRDLQALSPSVSPREADLMAWRAIEESAKLCQQWRPMHGAWANNILVNAGMRSQGLCYQWRNALYVPLHKLRLKTLQMHLVVSRRATPREHNAIVVTARGRPMPTGIILDAWRNGGRLWWGPLSADPRHPWEVLPRDLTPVELRPYIFPPGWR